MIGSTSDYIAEIDLTILDGVKQTLKNINYSVVAVFMHI